MIHHDADTWVSPGGITTVSYAAITHANVRPQTTAAVVPETTDNSTQCEQIQEVEEVEEEITPTQEVEEIEEMPPPDDPTINVPEATSEDIKDVIDDIADEPDVDSLFSSDGYLLPTISENNNPEEEYDGGYIAATTVRDLIDRWSSQEDLYETPTLTRPVRSKKEANERERKKKDYKKDLKPRPRRKKMSSGKSSSSRPSDDEQQSYYDPLYYLNSLEDLN